MNRYLVILLVLLFPLALIGQVNIGGDALNTYYSVATSSGANSITCKATENLLTLSPGDKVLLIQMTGAEFFNFNVDVNYTFEPYANNEGRYEFLSVLSVNNSTKEVVFTANLKNTYTAGEKIQLVKVFEAVEATVSSELTAPDWDSAAGKGGILAMVILRKLTLNADINLSGKGFGGAESIPYLVACRTSSATDTMYYPVGSLNKGGLKGEGIKSVSSNYIIGPGNNFNGGGGGIGKFGGGGGGSNYNFGGRGGAQKGCSTNNIQRASGGIGLQTGRIDGFSYFPGFYSAYNKITFGGGGGGSTDSISLIATKGGDGGGILIILTDTLVGNGGAISINGESVTTTATAGAGGGGAGGTLMLDVAAYTGSIQVNLHGGDGGNTSGVGSCGGAGGGGSGGVLLHSFFTLPNNIIYDVSAGDYGRAQCSSLNDGVLSYAGDTVRNYQIVLNGFTFNAITGIDTICNGQTPNVLIGTTPKGATNYQFQWLISSDNVNWNPIGGATSKNYQPPALTDTTFYTREVYFPDGGIRDTAISVQIIVYPDIYNNILTLRDTVCQGSSPGLLSAMAVSGGDGVTYNYIWESSIDQSNWITRSTGTTALFNETNVLMQTTYYRRHVESGSGGVCYSPSNIDTITALEPIVGNGFLNPFVDTIICNGLQAGNILGTPTTGGDGSPHRYSWIRSTDNISYNTIGSANSINYNPGILSTANYYFKRIVYSGEGDACIDTTTVARTVEVLPSITNNNIASDSTRYCYADTPLELKQASGSISGGQGAGSYIYQWQQYNGALWSDISGANSAGFSPGSLTDSSTYRRIVSSGLIGSIYACANNSTSLTIEVIPEITNSLVSEIQTICQEIQPLGFIESGASGGAGSGTFTYLWEESLDGINWSPASGVRDQTSYTAPVLNSTTMYRRVAISQICALASDSIRIEVYDKITSNSVLGAANQYTCYNTSKQLMGSQPLGGENNVDFVYIWESSLDGNAWNSASGNAKDFNTPALILPNYYRRVVQSGSESECSDTSNIVLTNINQLPTGDITSGTDTLCAGDIIEISYENLTGVSPWIIVLGESRVLYTTDKIAATSGTILFEIDESASIKALSIKDDSSCFADITVNTGEIIATVYEVPVANAGENFEVCGLDAQLNATFSTPGVGIWTSDEGTFNDSSLSNAILSMTSYGMKSILWKETNWECSDEASIDVNFFEQTLLTEAGSDQVLPYKFNTVLEATPAVSPASGYWQFTQGTGVLTDSTQANTSVEMVGLGRYVLRWTIINGACLPVNDSVIITIKDLELDNGFSPNGDDVNDEYKLKFPSGNVIKFTILDRNGNLVRVISATEEIVWDGTNENGQQIPSDTYFYIIEEDGRSPRKGYIDIRR